MATLRELLRDAGTRLGTAGIDQPRRDAAVLAGHALGLSREKLFALSDQPLKPGMARALGDVIQRRLAREPVAYITGEREFWSLPFHVGRETLIPRPDSETLIELALRLIPDTGASMRIADLGTGTGCLLLSMLSELPQAFGVGIDISAGAAAIARSNARRLGLESRARFVVADWAAPIAGKFDLILCNPPYVATDELSALEPEVVRFEPRRALHGGADAMAAYRVLAPELARLLAPGGIAVVEFGSGMGGGVGGLMRAVGMTTIERSRDLAGIERCAAYGLSPPSALSDEEMPLQNG